MLPWRVLLDDSSLQHSVRHIAGRDIPVRDIHFGEYRIWGATAGILLRCASSRANEHEEW